MSFLTGLGCTTTWPAEAGLGRPLLSSWFCCFKYTFFVVVARYLLQRIMAALYVTMGRWNEDTTSIPMAFRKKRSKGRWTGHATCWHVVAFGVLVCVYIPCLENERQLEESCQGGGFVSFELELPLFEFFVVEQFAAIGYCSQITL